MSNTRVLVVIDQLGFGGAERHAVFLGTQLSKCGLQPFLVSLYGGGKLEGVLKKSNSPYYADRSLGTRIKESIPDPVRYRLKSIKSAIAAGGAAASDNVNLRQPHEKGISIQTVAAFRALEESKEQKVKRILQQFQPGVVHVHTWHCKRVLEWAHHCNVKKVIYGHHNMISVRHNGEEIRQLSHYMTFATDATFDSIEQKRDFLQHIPFPVSRTHVIPPVSGFSTSPMKEYGSVGEVTTIGTLSNLGPVKGVVFLLDAASKLKARKVPVKVVIGGESIWRLALEKECLALGLGDIVRFAGRVKSLEQFFEDLDLFVLPSLSEAMPLVLIEAMSAGLPIVASRVGGIPEVVDDGKTGLLLEPANAMELARKIEYLCNDPKEREAMGRGGLERYKEVFSNERVLALYKQVYLN